NHLYAGGCRKVAFIGAHCESESQHYRRKGFLNRCKELCIEADVYLTRDEDAKGEIDSLYEKLRQYQGLFAWNDSVAIELLHIFARNGCRIPQDIQMIGFDNTYIGSLFLPALTTIAQNIPEIAAKTVECFAETQAGKTDSRNVFVDVQLIQRATTIGEHRAT
ncbi:MAG: substrate-binding domain-containing protein, partial [Ruthenibacterium sp.]